MDLQARGGWGDGVRGPGRKGREGGNHVHAHMCCVLHIIYNHMNTTLMYAHKTFQNSGDIYPMPAPEDPNYQNIVQIIDNKPEVVAVAKKVDQKVKVKRSWSGPERSWRKK